MKELRFEEYIAEPVENVKNILEAAGYTIKIVCFDKPKTQTDTKLVVRAKLLSEKQVELVVGDFLINKEV